MSQSEGALCRLRVAHVLNAVLPAFHVVLCQQKKFCSSFEDRKVYTCWVRTVCGFVIHPRLLTRSLSPPIRCRSTACHTCISARLRSRKSDKQARHLPEFCRKAMTLEKVSFIVSSRSFWLPGLLPAGPPTPTP